MNTAVRCTGQLTRPPNFCAGRITKEDRCSVAASAGWPAEICAAADLPEVLAISDIVHSSSGREYHAFSSARMASNPLLRKGCCARGVCNGYL
jgi:hypothetical protein